MLNTGLSWVNVDLLSQAELLRNLSLRKDISNNYSSLSWFTIGIILSLFFQFDPSTYHHSHFFPIKWHLTFLFSLLSTILFLPFNFICLSSSYRKTFCKFISLLFPAWHNVTLYLSFQFCLAYLFIIFICICHSVRNIFISYTSIE